MVSKWSHIHKSQLSGESRLKFKRSKNTVDAPLRIAFLTQWIAVSGLEHLDWISVYSDSEKHAIRPWVDSVFTGLLLGCYFNCYFCFDRRNLVLLLLESPDAPTLVETMRWVITFRRFLCQDFVDISYNFCLSVCYFNQSIKFSFSEKNWNPSDTYTNGIYQRRNVLKN